MKSPSSFWMRVLAHNIDIVVLLGPLYLLSYYVENNLLFYSIAFILYMIYHMLFELSPLEGSPGKYFNQLKVKNLDGSDCEPSKVIIRTFCRILSIAPFFLGYTMALFHPRRLALHDIITGSCVFYSQKNRKIPIK